MTMVLAWDMTMVVIVIMIIKNLPFMKAVVRMGSRIT
jgi:hypothetical protein